MDARPEHLLGLPLRKGMFVDRKMYREADQVLKRLWSTSTRSTRRSSLLRGRQQSAAIARAIPSSPR